jgi:regulator of replication initiation timing
LKQDVSGLKSDVGGLKQDVSELKSDVAIIKVELVELRESQVRLESEFHNQITALHDFRVSQEKVNQETKNGLITLGTKLGELQMETAHLRVVK